MSYDFEIYVTGVSPAQAMNLFNIEVEEGKESYEIPQDDGAYVFYSGFTRQLASELIFESTGMNLETYAWCSISRGRGLNTSQMQTDLVDNALHNICNDFLALNQFECIIAMRKSGEVIVNSLASKEIGIDLSIFDMPHQFRDLPYL